MLIASAVVILLQLYSIVQRCVGLRYGTSIPSYVIAACCGLVSFLLVVGAFACSFSGKWQRAIVCTVSSLIVQLGATILYGSSVWGLLPQVMLLIFLLRGKRNIKIWAWLAWIIVLLPTGVSYLYISMLWGVSTSVSIILSMILGLCSQIPLGFVYYFGFTAPNNAVQQQKGAKESTATSYLEEYKRKRKNGGQ